MRTQRDSPQKAMIGNFMKGHEEPDHRKHKDAKIQSEQFAQSDNPGGKLHGDSNSDGGRKRKSKPKSRKSIEKPFYARIAKTNKKQLSFFKLT